MLELAREADWESVQRLSVQLHDLHVSWRPDLYFHSEEPYPRERFLEDIRKRMIYVAKIENSIVGYVILSLKVKEGPGCISQRALLLESICVDETVRGHGIGSEIVTDVRALAKAFRCSSLILGVHPENEAALAFYQKCGFSLRTLNLQLNV